LDRLCRKGSKGLASTSRTGLLDAVDRAQRIAAWNCAFPGARGGMYSAEGRRELRSLVRVGRRLRATHCEEESDEAAAQICGCSSKRSADETAVQGPSQTRSQPAQSRGPRAL
jgi:hypothetical protein